MRILRFIGGPLDGAELLKTWPGRFPAATDEAGAALDRNQHAAKVRNQATDYYAKGPKILDLNSVDIGRKYVHVSRTGPLEA